MASDKVQKVTDDNFESEVLKSNLPVLVDFWAEWCGPCRALSPTIDDLANQYSDKLKVCKMNVDENPQTPSQYKIRGIPTLLLFKNGQLEDQIVGAQSKENIVQVIQKLLS